MSAAPALLPCPFGCQAHPYPSHWIGARRPRVNCPTCFTEGPSADSVEEAIAAWNRRPAPAPGLEEAVEKLRDYWDQITNTQRGVTASQRLYIAQQYPELSHADEINDAIEEFEMLHGLIPTLLLALTRGDGRELGAATRASEGPTAPIADCN